MAAASARSTAGQGPVRSDGFLSGFLEMLWEPAGANILPRTLA